MLYEPLTLRSGTVVPTRWLSGEQVWSASTWQEDAPTFEVPRAATEDDLARVRVIEQFAAAALGGDDQETPRAELLERSASPVFIGYLTRWKNFVA